MHCSYQLASLHLKQTKNPPVRVYLVGLSKTFVGKCMRGDLNWLLRVKVKYQRSPNISSIEASFSYNWLGKTVFFPWKINQSFPRNTCANLWTILIAYIIQTNRSYLLGMTFVHFTPLKSTDRVTGVCIHYSVCLFWECGSKLIKHWCFRGH